LAIGLVAQGIFKKMLGKEAKICTSPQFKIGIGLVAQDIFKKMLDKEAKFLYKS
jgi:hypothetical protein